MPQPSLQKGNVPLDSVFRSYDSGQAAAYAAHRSKYSPDLYGLILDRFRGGGGHFSTLLDIGCGTGKVTHTLGKYFEHAIGVDHSEEMISQARQADGRTKVGNPIQFEVGSAEELDTLHSVQPASVDLLTVGMAVHWFRLDRFWRSVERMVKPGGMIALWTHSSLYCHPSTRNATEIQKALSYLEDDILRPYETPSIKLSRNMYDNLTMPWEVETTNAAFPRGGFVRYEWNRNGAIEEGEMDFFGGSQEVTLDELRGSLGTASMVTQWREANPGIAGTEGDCVELTIKKIAQAMGFGEADAGTQKLQIGNATTLMMFTRTL